MSTAGGMEDNGTAFTHLLWLVSRGQALVAELLRLTANVPPVFNPELEPKYADILIDFRYFKVSDAHEEKIERSALLLELDDEFRDSNLPMIERFFQLFDRIVRLYQDMRKFMDDLREGMYIQQTVEGLLADMEGKQLLIELTYAHGVLLLLLDQRMDPKVKEHIVVSFYRYRGASDIPNVDDIVKLCRATGYNPAAPTAASPAGYPEQYLARFPLPRKILSMIVGRLRMDDVYNQIKHYPKPEHRSRALSQQAACLYVLLYFVPDVLHDETAVMREIVDKHFVDNWVVLYVTGHTVDLTLQWSKYHAANAALQNVIDPATAKRIQMAATAELGPLRRRLAEYLSEGVLTDQYVLRHMDDVMGVLRHCNVALQWTLLHSTTRNRKLLDAMHNHAPAADDVLGMLLDVADVEFRLREVYEGLLASKEERWAASQRAAVEAVAELGEFFSGSKVLSKHIKDDNLKNWFGSIQAEVEKLAAEEPVVAGRRIQQLIAALEAVEQFHQFDRVLQTKQYLLETRQHLMDMVRTANVQQEALYTFAVVSDFSYAFGPILAAYTPHMHRRIQSQPFAVLKLQCLFLKLKSMMELPLLRISQCGSPDLVSVSEYYSQELISYVREVMEVIPASMFSTLDTIIGLQTGRLRELPTKLEKDRLKEFAQLQERYLLAHATHGIAIFTQGILAMERTLMGVIEIDPRQLLEEGIRKQLVMRISEIAHTELQFTVKETSMFGMVRWVERDFEERLRALSARLAGFRRSFEYIQDYVCIYGLRVWQEEFQRIINYNVEQECNTFLKRQVRDWQSEYQSAAVPIPRFLPSDDASVNLMGRLTRELLRQTAPDRTMYLFPLSGWFDTEGKEVVGIRMFAMLKDSVGVLGLAGIDKLLCFMVVHRLQRLLANYRSLASAECAPILAHFKRSMEPLNGLPDDAHALYAKALELMPSAVWDSLLPTVTLLGQAQLLRRQIGVEASTSCKLDSNSLSCALETTNFSVMTDVRAHYLQPDTAPYPGDKNTQLVPQLSQYLTTTGIHQPITQIYITTDPLADLPGLLFLFTLTLLPKYAYDAHLSVLAPRVRKGTPDACALTVGLITLLRQFHASDTQTYLMYLAQYIRTLVQPGAPYVREKNGKNALSTEAAAAVCFLEDFGRYGHLERETLAMYLPPFLMDHRDCHA